MNNEELDDDMSWIRSRPSFREAYSRGSQTTTADPDEFDLLEKEDEAGPRSSANNVRRASLLLGGLNALYNSQCAEVDAQERSVRFEIRSPPSKTCPYNIYYHNQVIPELTRVLQCRRDWNDKCQSFQNELVRRRLHNCFVVWRTSNLKYIQKDLLTSVDENSNNFFRQRRTSVVKVWSRISMSLNAHQKKVFERRGCTDLAAEAVAQRVLGNSNDGTSITGSTLDEEADSLISSRFGLDIWLSGYYKITYFRMWRDSIRLPTMYYNKKLCRGILVYWRDETKTASSLAIDYTRYIEAKAFSRRKIIRSVFKRWKRRLQIQHSFASLCARLYTSSVEKKREVLHHWKIYMLTNQVYCKLPFQQWREHTFIEKHRSRIYDRLLLVYLRSKSRQKLRDSFRLWKQDVKCKEVTSLYTRNELASGLLDQKQKCTMLTHKNNDMAKNVASFEQQQKKLESQVLRLEIQLTKSEQARNIAEQELSTLKAADKISSGSGLSYTGSSNIQTLCPVLIHSRNMI